MEQVTCRHCGTTFGELPGRIARGRGKYCSRECSDEGKHARAQGYVTVNNKRLHRIVAERALGRPLPPSAVVHHWGELSEHGKLVICEDQSYHMLLHARERVLRAGGNPNTQRICSTCRLVKAHSGFYLRKSGARAGQLTNVCRECSTRVRRSEAA